MPRYIHLTETASTNTYLAATARILPAGTVIYTYRQTAGRGQKGNHWESEPDKNLTFSMLIKPAGVAARQQFCISEAVAVAVVEVLSRHGGAGFSIKWPNDIYHHDGKVAGLLIEHSLQGADIEHSILGVGVNINQRQFMSDAPNPVSLAQITGQQHNLEQLLHEMCERMEQLCAPLDREEARSALHRRYMEVLYRNDGHSHPFALPDGTRFMAAIDNVDARGTLTLKRDDGTSQAFAFKEVAHVIEKYIL